MPRGAAPKQEGIDKRLCLVVGGAAAAVVAFLSLVIAFNYRDAALGRKTKSAIRRSMLERGAKIERGAYVGGPLKPNVRINDETIADAIVTTFMQRLDAATPRAAPIEGAPPKSPPHTGPVGMPPVKPPTAASPYDITDGEGGSGRFDPEERLREYEVGGIGGRGRRGVSSATAVGGGGGGGDDTSDEEGEGAAEEDFNYRDPAAARMGPPPDFPEAPVNTCVRLDESSSGAACAVGRGPGKRRPRHARTGSATSSASTSSAASGRQHRHHHHRDRGGAVGPLQTAHGHRVSSPETDAQQQPAQTPAQPQPPALETEEAEYDLTGGGGGGGGSYTYTPDL